jgi:protein SCO1/2
MITIGGTLMRRVLIPFASAALAAACLATHAQTASTATAHEHVHSAPNADAAASFDGIRADFELLDRTGNIVRDEDFRGRYLLLGFGFTHCADVCPAMAFGMASALDTNPTAAGVFVSVDTERDPAAITDRYARAFHERLIGLGGSLEQVNAAAQNFRVSYAVTKTQNTYIVQHTSYVYLIDPTGALAQVFSSTTSPAEIAAAMK